MLALASFRNRLTVASDRILFPKYLEQPNLNTKTLGVLKISENRIRFVTELWLFSLVGGMRSTECHNNRSYISCSVSSVLIQGKVGGQNPNVKVKECRSATGIEYIPFTLEYNCFYC